MKEPKDTGFRIRQRQVAIYTNDGQGSIAVWSSTYQEGLQDKVLIAAIHAAREAFNKIWLQDEEEAIQAKKGSEGAE